MEIDEGLSFLSDIGIYTVPDSSLGQSYTNLYLIA
jgi:hypothetical protein